MELFCFAYKTIAGTWRCCRRCACDAASSPSPGVEVLLRMTQAYPVVVPSDLCAVCAVCCVLCAVWCSSCFRTSAAVDCVGALRGLSKPQQCAGAAIHDGLSQLVGAQVDLCSVSHAVNATVCDLFALDSFCMLFRCVFLGCSAVIAGEVRLQRRGQSDVPHVPNGCESLQQGVVSALLVDVHGTRRWGPVAVSARHVT